MKKSDRQVPVQKGPINPNPTTLKQMTHSERLKDRAHELSELKRCQTLDYKSPRQK